MIDIFVRFFLIGVIFALLWINGKQASKIRVLLFKVNDLEVRNTRLEAGRHD